MRRYLPRAQECYSLEATLEVILHVPVPVLQTTGGRLQGGNAWLLSLRTGWTGNAHQAGQEAGPLT